MVRALGQGVTAALVLAVAGLAPPAVAAGGGCTTNLDCKGGRVCVSGDCVDPPKPCGKDVDCPGDWVCTDHHCGPSSAAPTTPTATPPTPPPSRTREAPGCRDTCQAERNDCNDRADSKNITCRSNARDSKKASLCAAQAQDEHGECSEEYSNCLSACR